MGALGGGGQKTESGNHAYKYITDTYSPMAEMGAPSMSQAAGILGLGGGDPQAIQKYFNGTGGQFQLNNGLDAINNKFASMGLSHSGAAMKAMETFRSGLASQTINNYLGQLSDLTKNSLGAGALISNAGQYQKGSGGGGGLGSLLGTLLAVGAMAATGGAAAPALGAGEGAGLALSDKRMKTNLEPLTMLPDGLPVWAFDYRRDLDPSLPEGRQIGVMAQDVEKLRPWALGPTRDDGMMTVDYSRLSIPENAVEFI
jgi:hypothetical protein